MYILAINGSPRKAWNTAQLLQSALKGAEDCGATTELIHLYDYDKYEYLQARVTPAEKETVTAHAEAMGKSLKLLNLDFYVFLINYTKKTVRGELL